MSLGGIALGWTFFLFLYVFYMFCCALVSSHVINDTNNERDKFAVSMNARYITMMSLGTSAFASLIYTIVFLLKNTLEDGSRRNSNDNYNRPGSAFMSFVYFIMILFVSVLEQIIKVFNRFALSYAAIRGTSLYESFKQSTEGMAASDSLGLMTDFSIEYIFYFMSFVQFVFFASTNYLYFRMFVTTDVAMVTLIVSAVLAILSTHNLLTMIPASTATLSFIFALDENRIKAYDKKLYETFKRINKYE